MTAKEKIRPSLLMVLIICFIHGSTLLLSLVDSGMKQDAWMAIVCGAIVSMPFILSYVFLSKRFPGKSLIQIHDIVYGNVLGKILSICYFFFFMLLFAYNMRQIVEFLNGYIMSETPPIALYITIALVCTYAVKKGIHVIAKMSMYAVAFVVFAAVMIFLLLLGKMDFSNFLPMFNAPPEEYIRTTYIMAAIPFSELLFLVMVMPRVRPLNKAARYVTMGVGLATLLYLLIIVRITATLGESSPLYTESSFQSVRLIDIGEFLTRLELIIALGIIATIFIKISVLYFAAVKSISEILKLRSFNPLLLPLAGIAIVLALIACDSSVVNADNADYHIVFATPFEFILPPLTLLIAKLRKLPKKDVCTNQDN